MEPTLYAMIFRRLCAPKKNNDALHRLNFFGAQIHSESHGPMRRFKVYRVLARPHPKSFSDGVYLELVTHKFQQNKVKYIWKDRTFN